MYFTHQYYSHKHNAQKKITLSKKMNDRALVKLTKDLLSFVTFDDLTFFNIQKNGEIIARMNSIPGDVNIEHAYSCQKSTTEETWKCIEIPNTMHAKVQWTRPHGEELSDAKKKPAEGRKHEPQDHASRLQQHLAIAGYEIKRVPGDNNCQFHAVVDQLEQVDISGWDAANLRAATVEWLKEYGEKKMDDGAAGGETPMLKDAVGVSDWDVYIREMSRDGVTWGDEGTLLAASALFGAEITVYSSVSEKYIHKITPPPAWKIAIKIHLVLGHYHEYHYASTRKLKRKIAKQYVSNTDGRR